MKSNTYRGSNRPIEGYSATSFITNAENNQSHSYNNIPPVSEKSSLLQASNIKPSVVSRSFSPQSPVRRKDDFELSTNKKDVLFSPDLLDTDKATSSKSVSPQDTDDAANANGVSAQDAGETKSVRFRDLPRSSKYIILMLVVAHTLHMMSYSLIGPFYTQEALKKGTSQGQVGLIFSIFAFAICISTPIYGANIAVLGQKFILFSGILVSGSSCILFGVLEYCPGGVMFTTMSYLVRGLDGLGVAAYSVGAYSTAFGACPDFATFVAGIMMSAQTVGMCVGPVVGSILFEIGGFGLPFYAVGAAILVNGVMLYGSISSIIKVKERRNTAISRFSLLGSPLAWLAFATSSVLSATLGSLSANLALYVTETMGSTVLSVGVMFGVWPLVFALTSPVVGWLCKKQGIEQFINPLSTFSVGLSFAMLGPTPILPFLPSSEWIVYVGLAVLGCAYAGCSLSAVKLYFVSAMDKGMGDNLDTFGMISSMLNSGSSSGTVWGAAASGFLTSNLGFPWTAAITSCVSWTLTLIAILLFSLRRRKKLSGENIRLLSSADTGNGSGDGAEETSSAVYNIAAK